MGKFFIYFFLLSCCFLSCNSSKEVASASEQDRAAKLNCQLPRVLDGSIALGFPKVDVLAPSSGKVNMTVLFADFNDVPATQPTDSVFAIINPIGPDFYKEISYGRMELNLIPHLKWLRLSQPAEHYGKGIYEFYPHRAFIQEAVDLANDQVDFSQTDIVLVLANPEASAIQMGPTFTCEDPELQIKADGASIATGITSGFDLNFWGGDLVGA